MRRETADVGQKDGMPIAFIAFPMVLHDASRRKNKLMSAETRNRRAFEAAMDGILILDAASGEVVDRGDGVGPVAVAAEELKVIDPCRDRTGTCVVGKRAAEKNSLRFAAEV